MSEQDAPAIAINAGYSDQLFLGGGGAQHGEAQTLLLKYGNRHGLISGATGTGKTVTLQVLAEGFSNAGVPVFLSDIKGDLSGLCQAGSPDHKLHDKLIERANTIGFGDYDYDSFPVVFWDLFGEQGHPVRATVSEMGPLLLSRMLDLNETQEGVLNIAFRVADDDGLLLLDFKDLRAILVEVGNRASELTNTYGYVSKATVGAIQRRLLVLENQGAAQFFGEPALKLSDMIRLDGARGQVNILAADQLMQSPRLYATFLLWLLSELFEELPEVGDPDKPVMAFFFDEAHLLFDDAPKALLEKVEQVARLIRSKGVGVYFITQNPADVPDNILGQLGNRVQHALRAYTPRDQRAIRAASETFRPNPDFATIDVITQLGVGEALVSTLEAKGVPSVVERTLIRPPASRLGPADDSARRSAMRSSPMAGLYDDPVDRESAFEILRRQADEAAEQAEHDAALEEKQKAERASKPRRSQRQTATEAFFKSAVRSAGSRIGRSLVRGLLGGLFKGR